MKAVWIPKYGKPDVLELREAEDPSPGPGEVRIRVRASGINFAEIMARQASDDTTSVDKKCLRAKVDLPELVAPTNTTNENSGSIICMM